MNSVEPNPSRNTRKLMAKWEGPYKVKEVLRPETYKLENMDAT